MSDLIPFDLSSNLLILQSAADDLLKTNEISEQFGLSLSRPQAVELVRTKNQALKGFGRVEIGPGILNKLIDAFCDCPYLWQANYAEMLNELVETFYYAKNETLDEVGDDDLLAWMRDEFENNCHGSIELLQGRELEWFARQVRYGAQNDADEVENGAKWEENCDGE